MLEMHPDPDGCRWLPGARLNIAECALNGAEAAAAFCASMPATLPAVLHALATLYT
jgi:hypothetical protein